MKVEPEHARVDNEIPQRHVRYTKRRKLGTEKDVRSSYLSIPMYLYLSISLSVCIYIYICICIFRLNPSTLALKTGSRNDTSGTPSAARCEGATHSRYVYICVCIHICMYIYIYICLSVYIEPEVARVEDWVPQRYIGYAQRNELRRSNAK